MTSSEDEYEKYCLKFTQEDLASIDAAATTETLKGGPAITVEVQPLANVSGSHIRSQMLTPSNKKRTQTKSPFEQYRAFNNMLYVSDLVSPAWYGFRSILITASETAPIGVRCNFTITSGRRMQGRTNHGPHHSLQVQES